MLKHEIWMKQEWNYYKGCMIVWIWEMYETNWVTDKKVVSWVGQRFNAVKLNSKVFESDKGGLIIIFKDTLGYL